ncbi:MAG: hypothetical protein H6726_18580 [Sandaracinaceae bacterium]|nr:hypothetical protein [Sandaracinaceae bacterium]
MRALTLHGMLGRVLTVVLWGLLLAPFGLRGCASKPVDPRFAEPEATVRTLFTVYDVADLEEAEVQALLRQRVQFQVRDRDAYEACFADWRDPHDEGLAGFVFGRLAALKGHLRYEPSADGRSMRVIPMREGEAGHPVVLRRTDDGWKIALRESVPDELRQRLYRVYEEARRRERG